MFLLLDIDGVMVPAAPWKRPEFLNDGFLVFSTKATQALQQILATINCTIILTTSHKHNHTIAEWYAIFQNRGIAGVQIERLPPNDHHLNRKEEIERWLSANPTEENFVILDDDKSLNGLPQDLKKHLVITSPLIGLTPDLANEAIRILEGEALIN
jgi:hypothetical protein